MAIPFTQYLRPDGRRRETEIERPAEIEALAEAFISSGGKFECEELMTGEVSLTAVHLVEDEPDDIAIQVAKNAPGVVGEATDALVREAAKWLEERA